MGGGRGVFSTLSTREKGKSKRGGGQKITNYAPMIYTAPCVCFRCGHRYITELVVFEGNIKYLVKVFSVFQVFSEESI